MKKNTSVFTVILLILLHSGCSYLSRPALSTDITWEEVESRYLSYETVSDFKAIEEFSKEMLEIKWAQWQTQFLKFKLAKTFFYQGDYKKSLEIFNDLRGVKPFVNETHLLAGEASLKIKEYDAALKWVLSIYLKLNKDEKTRGSKIVFLSYLYSKRIEKAATWYSKLDVVKKENSRTELEEWLALSITNKNDFNNYLSMVAKDSEDIPSDIKDKALEEMKKLEEIEDAHQLEEYLETDEDLIYNTNYVPEWKNLCIAISSDEKWIKFNDVIKNFMNWYFSDYKKSDLNLIFLNYLDEKSIASLFEKAEENRCFVIAGPFFAPELAHDFKENSLLKSIPVISYIPYISTLKGIFFNVMPTKDVEAENILKYALNEKGKKKFALAYIDNREGRQLRDIYWSYIESLGGVVTDIIDLSPADNAFFDDVEKVVYKQDDFEDALKTFRWKNKEKFSNPTLLNRAVERFIKTIPGKCNFDTLVVLTPITYMPMFLPSFPYMNIEFEYYQKYLNRNVSLRKSSLRQEGFEWDIQQILVLSPSEIINNGKVIEQLGQLVDGMIVYAPVNDFTESNQAYTEISSKFKEKSNRNLYFIENFIAEVCEIIFQGLEKSNKKDISGFITALKETEFLSILSGSAVKFDSNNRITGRNVIMIGRNKEPFMTPAQIEEEKKKKEETKKEEAKNKKETENKKE